MFLHFFLNYKIEEGKCERTYGSIKGQSILFPHQLERAYFPSTKRNLENTLQRGNTLEKNLVDYLKIGKSMVQMKIWKIEESTHNQ